MRTNKGTTKSKKVISETEKKPQKKNNHYLQLSNQEYLLRTLKLMGVQQSQYLKETKFNLNTQFFPKTIGNPSSSKPFFYITYICFKNILTEEEMGPLAMWYPPRTVNEQLQYKKVMFKFIQDMQVSGKLPKNILISKATIMGDTNSSSLIEFLRFLAQMALRSKYLELYSKQERLIQLALTNQKTKTKQNDINRFYVYPFVPSKTASDLPSQANIPELRKLYKYYINIYMKKIMKLRTQTAQNQLNSLHQKVMSEFMEQKQLAQALNSKIPKKILTQNRAFDRRRLIDRNQEIWQELNKIQCFYLTKETTPILKVEGEIDKILSKWEPTQNLKKLHELNAQTGDIDKLKRKFERSMESYEKIKRMILNELS